MKKLLIIKSLFICVFVVLNSCTSNDEFEVKQIERKQATSLVTPEALELKEMISSQYPRIEKLVKNQSTRGYNDSEIEKQEAEKVLASLSSVTIKMLKSYGFSEKDWSEFEGTDDPTLILAGIFYLGMIDSNKEQTPIPTMKNRTEEGSSEVCFDPYRVLDCAVQATGLSIMIDVFLGKCITRAVAWALFKTIASKLSGPIAVAIALGDFAHCMGFI